MVKKTRKSSTRITVLLATLATSLASVAQTDRVELPDMGASSDSIISRKEEEDYAKALVRQMRAYEVLNEDPLINAYFEDMGFRLVANSDRPDKPFTFVIINQPVVNAFAAPGGVVALYSGLILSADDEHEIAGVLAHEVAHITQQHLYRAIENQQAMSIPLALAMLGLVLAGGGSGEAIQGALIGGQAAAQQAQIHFTRQNEAEADRIGIRTLSRAGYDPRGMAEFFEKMSRITRARGEGPPEYLRTHPVNVSRIAEAEDRALDMPKPEKTSGRDFYLVQARLRAQVEDYPETVLKYFRHEKSLPERSPAQRSAMDYGIAIALQRKGEYEEARRVLESLMAEGDHLAYQIQLADLDLQTGRVDQAIDRLADLYRGFPGNHAISLEYSEALLHDGDVERAKQASKVLREQLLSHSEDPVLYSLYARASNTAGNEVRAKEAIAESYYLRGGIHEAIQQLQELIEREDLSYYERARITARLNEYQVEVTKLGLEEHPPAP
ncbi:beta-barrel assembly-enhancing protease [Elongatibacter sediminis]|uniref:Putative beta-barrel assembly-enhancing protease n=1 Tax=Elongatibacter sediminis TaxID=3119006 RepID=A0AAW9RG88_9GAMM